MTVKKYLLKDITEAPKEEYNLTVPENAKFLCVKFLSTTVGIGVFAFYQVSEEEQKTKLERFFVVENNSPILPMHEINLTFVGIVDPIVEIENGEQATLLLPIYKL